MMGKVFCITLFVAFLSLTIDAKPHQELKEAHKHHLRAIIGGHHLKHLRNPQHHLKGSSRNHHLKQAKEHHLRASQQEDLKQPNDDYLVQDQNQLSNDVGSSYLQARDWYPPSVIQYPYVVSNGLGAFSGNIASGGWGTNSRGGDGNQLGTFVGNGNNGGNAAAGSGGSSDYGYSNYNYYPYWYY